MLEVARQARQSPQTCLRDYGHPFDEFDPAKREPAEAVISAARTAESSYSGISHSGNQRDTSSSNGSSFPTWDCRRSSRSLSRALSPFAGTNG
jgi:hypothetical protein